MATPIRLSLRSDPYGFRFAQQAWTMPPRQQGSWPRKRGPCHPPSPRLRRASPWPEKAKALRIGGCAGGTRKGHGIPGRRVSACGATTYGAARDACAGVHLTGRRSSVELPSETTLKGGEIVNRRLARCEEGHPGPRGSRGWKWRTAGPTLDPSPRCWGYPSPNVHSSTYKRRLIERRPNRESWRRPFPRTARRNTKGPTARVRIDGGWRAVRASVADAVAGLRSAC